MLEKIEKIYDEKVINWFYIILPLVEVMTTYMVVHTSISITIGVVYKTLYLVYCTGYLVFFDKEKRGLTLSVLSLFLISVVINFFVTIDNYSISSIVNKVSDIAKYLTFPLSMLFLYKYTVNGNKLHLKILVYSASIYASVMMVAKLTGTELPTYSGNSEFGHSGWFYSGNEISALMGIFYPIVIYYAGKYKTKLMSYSLLTLTYGLLAIGTKTSFVAICITIVCMFIFEIAMYIKRKDELSKNMLFTIFMLLVVLSASSPYSPSLKFIKERYETAKIQTEIQQNEQLGDSTATATIAENFVFNGRTQYLKKQMEVYSKIGILEKTFGMNESNKLVYEDGTRCIVERDMYDILFQYGIFGIIVYFIPIIYILIKFAIKVFKDFKNECNEKNYIMALSVALALGISYIAGHVLLAPTVALFLSVVVSKLNYEEDVLLIKEN